MKELMRLIEDLEGRGWSDAALSEELHVAQNTIYRWKSGNRYPSNPELYAEKLRQLLTRKRVPKRRRAKA